MLEVVQRLIRARQTLSVQLRALESGEVKVLTLLDGGSSDEDTTGEYLQQVRACLHDIDLALEEKGQSRRALHGFDATPDGVDAASHRHTHMRARGY